MDIVELLLEMLISLDSELVTLAAPMEVVIMVLAVSDANDVSDKLGGIVLIISVLMAMLELVAIFDSRPLVIIDILLVEAVLSIPLNVVPCPLDAMAPEKLVDCH